MWPNSPAAPLPSYSSPPKTRPPPTPVPTQTPRRFSNGRPAPRVYSPRTPTLTSLPTLASTPPICSTREVQARRGRRSPERSPPAAPLRPSRPPRRVTRFRLPQDRSPPRPPRERGADGPHDRVDHVRRDAGLRRRSLALPATAPSRSTTVWIFVPPRSTPAVTRALLIAQAPRSSSDKHRTLTKPGWGRRPDAAGAGGPKGGDSSRASHHPEPGSPLRRADREAPARPQHAEATEPAIPNYEQDEG